MPRITSRTAAILMVAGLGSLPAHATDIDGTKVARPASVTAGAALARNTPPSAETRLTPTEKDAQSRLERAGYTQIREIKSGPEGVSAKAVKDGTTVSVVVDSAGKIKESR